MLLGGPSPEDEEKYQIITAQLSRKNLVWAFVSLYRQRFPENGDENLEELKARVFQAEQKRNTLIHSLWVGGAGDAALRLKLIARGQHKLAAEEHTKTNSLTWQMSWRNLPMMSRDSPSPVSSPRTSQTMRNQVSNLSGETGWADFDRRSR